MAEYREFYDKTFEDMCDEIISLRTQCDNCEDEIESLYDTISQLQDDLQELYSEEE